MYVTHSQRALLLCRDMFILVPMTYPLMGGVYPQATSMSSKLLSCIQDFPVDFPVVNKYNVLTYLKLLGTKVLQIVQKGPLFNKVIQKHSPRK